MQPRGKVFWAKAAILLGAPVLLWAYPYGPDPGYAGVPGERGNCTFCHSGTAVNSAGGSVTVNFPSGLTYSPGVAQQLTVTIADPAQRAWGFELTARDASTASNVEGSFTSLDANTQLQCSQTNLQIFQPVAYGSSQACPAGYPLVYIEHSLAGYTATKGQTGSASYQFTWTPPASSVGNIVIYVAGNAANGDGTSSGDHIYTASYTLTPAANSFTNTYDFAHLALGNGFQTTLTYVNYSQQAVTCQTSFYSDSGAPLAIPFAGAAAASTRTDTLSPGGSLHQESQFDLTAPLAQGWAQAQCTGPIQASLLYRYYNSQGAAQGEASVIATAPATEFATFAQTQTGIALANPSSQPANITISAFDSTGVLLGSTAVTLAPNTHTASNVNNWLSQSFTGSVHIISTVPIVSLSLNAEAFPVFSSLPPGGLPDGTPLATGH